MSRAPFLLLLSHFPESLSLGTKCVSVRSHSPGTGSKDFAICRDSVGVAIVCGQRAQTPTQSRHPLHAGLIKLLLLRLSYKISEIRVKQHCQHMLQSSLF